MEQWLRQHRDMAKEVDGMCAPVRQSAKADWGNTTEGRLCGAARQVAFFTAPPAVDELRQDLRTRQVATAPHGKRKPRMVTNREVCPCEGNWQITTSEELSTPSDLYSAAHLRLLGTEFGRWAAIQYDRTWRHHEPVPQPAYVVDDERLGVREQFVRHSRADRIHVERRSDAA